MARAGPGAWAACEGWCRALKVGTKASSSSRGKRGRAEGQTLMLPAAPNSRGETPELNSRPAHHSWG